MPTTKLSLQLKIYIAYLIAVFLPLGCNASDLCGNNLVAEYASPDKIRKVVVFQRDCGATTGFSTQASLLELDSSLPKGSGNFFVADTNHGSAPSSTEGGPEVKVEWKDSNHLVLRHHSKARVFQNKRELQGIQVTYETFQ